MCRNEQQFENQYLINDIILFNSCIVFTSSKSFCFLRINNSLIVIST